MWYKLDENNNPVKANSSKDYFNWVTENEVKRIVMRQDVDGITISTVFLGLDHSWIGGPPVLWETMIFGGEHDQYQERYYSFDDALDGHFKALELVIKQK